MRNVDALAEAIGRYADDRDLLVRHQAACLESRAYAGLARYRADLVSVIRSLPARTSTISDDPLMHFQ